MAIIKSQIMKSVGKDVEKSKLPNTTGGNENWCSHQKKSDSSSKGWTESPSDPAAPLLGIHQREMKTFIYTKHVHKCL